MKIKLKTDDLCLLQFTTSLNERKLEPHSFLNNRLGTELRIAPLHVKSFLLPAYGVGDNLLSWGKQEDNMCAKILVINHLMQPKKVPVLK